MADPRKSSTFPSADPFASDIPNSNNISAVCADPNRGVVQLDATVNVDATSPPRHGAGGLSGLNSFTHSSPTLMPTLDTLPSAPASPIPANENSRSFDKSILDKINATIAKRTADMDAGTKKKESEILAAAKAYVQKQQQKREETVRAAQEVNMKTQQADKEQIEKYKKADEVWSAVGMVMDLKKPNSYSQNTESMRALLTKLQSNPPAPSSDLQGHAMVATAAVSLSK